MCFYFIVVTRIMLFTSWFMCLIWIFVIYKLLDRLIRIPKRRAPTSVVQNILVTGCDSGFGRLFAQRMANKGFRVFASCLTERGRAELMSSQPLITAFIMDVRDVASIEAAYQLVKKSLPPNEGLWTLVNNAGISGTRNGPSEWLVRQDYLDTADINLFGLIDVTRVFLPLVKKTRGRVVNVSSMGGRLAIARSAPYCVSKHGVEAYSDCLRREMAMWGVSVHIVEPTFYNTALAQTDTINASTRAAYDALPQHMKDEYGEEFITKDVEAVNKVFGKLLSDRLDDVVDCYEHASLAYFPRARYLPGRGDRLAFWALTLVPEWISDGIMARRYKPIKPKALQEMS